MPPPPGAYGQPMPPAPGPHPAAPAQLRPVRGLRTAAVVMLVIDAVVCLIASIIDVERAALIQRIIDDEPVEIEEIKASDALYAASGLLELAVYFVTAVMFLIWLYRARINAELLSPWPHRRSRPWVIWGWIVPIISLWFPKQIVDDIWASSQPGVLARSRDLASAPRSGLIWAWWLAWVFSLWIGQVSARLFRKADELPELKQAAQMDIFLNFATIVAAILAIAVVLSITRHQENHRLTAMSPWQPHPPM